MPQVVTPVCGAPRIVRGARTTHERNATTASGTTKWSMTIFARKVDTGEVVWAYQMTPFDQWDYDGINENMLQTTSPSMTHKPPQGADPLRP